MQRRTFAGRFAEEFVEAGVAVAGADGGQPRRKRSGGAVAAGVRVAPQELAAAQILQRVAQLTAAQLAAADLAPAAAAAAAATAADKVERTARTLVRQLVELPKIQGKLHHFRYLCLPFEFHGPSRGPSRGL